MNLAHVAVPDGNVRMIEVEPLHFARHICCADHGQRLAVEFEIVFVDAELGAGAQVVFVSDPEGGVIGPVRLAFNIDLRCDDVKSFVFRSVELDSP